MHNQTTTTTTRNGSISEKDSEPEISEKLRKGWEQVQTHGKENPELPRRGLPALDSPQPGDPRLPSVQHAGGRARDSSGSESPTAVSCLQTLADLRGQRIAAGSSVPFTGLHFPGSFNGPRGAAKDLGGGGTQKAINESLRAERQLLAHRASSPRPTLERSQGRKAASALEHPFRRSGRSNRSWAKRRLCPPGQPWPPLFTPYR